MRCRGIGGGRRDGAEPRLFVSLEAGSSDGPEERRLLVHVAAAAMATAAADAMKGRWQCPEVNCCSPAAAAAADGIGAVTHMEPGAVHAQLARSPL